MYTNQLHLIWPDYDKCNILQCTYITKYMENFPVINLVKVRILGMTFLEVQTQTMK